MTTPRVELAPRVGPTDQAEGLAEREALLARFAAVRGQSEALCEPLETEDYVPQSMPDASPVKWHLAHTTWFFETFLLKDKGAGDGGRGVAPGEYAYLFNSYYNALGERIPRHQRGLMTRPTVGEVYHYRALVDARVAALIAEADAPTLRRLAPLIVLGLNHEQQHQELIVTDLKHLLAANPVRPVYRARPEGVGEAPAAPGWVACAGGLREVGFDGSGDFSFDNESPRHQVFLRPYLLADRPATNAEYLAFMADGGYERPEFWLSDGWYARQAQGWTSPAYWERDPEAGHWSAWTLAGLRALDPAEPACHLSYYEADAFARWSGARLPTEAEWERAAAGLAVRGNFLENERFHPAPATAGPGERDGALRQVFGDVWEWTQSPYSPYPGFRPAAGALGEYNGKFMCNQFVLRGGSCATPGSHVRASYRNFFPPGARWQFSGVRLAQDA